MLIRKVYVQNLIDKLKYERKIFHRGPSRRTQDPLTAGSLPLVIALHIAALLLFNMNSESGEAPWMLHAFEWHFQILISLSAVLSLLLFFLPGSIYTLLLFRLGFYFLIAYPLGLTHSIVMIILATAVFEITIYLPLKKALWYLAGLVLISAALASAGSAFYLPREAARGEDIFIFSVVIFFLSASLLAYKSIVLRLREAEENISHLKSVISQLSHANLDFQRYVHSVEYSTVNSERRRISSEIHDTVGYSLTNILMTLEAANALIEKDQKRAQQALTRAITEAQDCLEETRRSMREMRSNELKEAVGLQAIAHLVRSFSEATGMEIRVEYGNAPDSFGRKIDLVLFRIIQEGLTNSFRHGMAGLVRITLWIEESNLSVTILDDGHGTPQIVEGLGISGMRERIATVGGNVEFSNQLDGFKVKVCLPLPEGMYEQNTSSVG